MGDSRSAAAIDRLPWLDDEPAQVKRQRRLGLWAWVPIGLLAIAFGSYWLGTRSLGSDGLPPSSAQNAATTAPLPDARATEPAVAEPAIEPIVESAPPPVIERSAPAPHPRVRHGRAVTRPATPPAAPARTIAKPKPLTYWPAYTSAGASGRMVRIGTFSSRVQAKKGWRRVVHIYPGIKRIPAAVVALPSQRDGRTYYRLQMGTTSQAHSEVLCQRMRIIGQSCIVVGVGQKAA